jgi:hypothetical protein
MPNSQSVPQLAHPNQHPNPNFSTMSNQYSLAHLRAMQNGQHLQPHMVNGGPQAGGPLPITQGQQMQPSDHQGHNPLMAQYPHMYYAQMGMNYSRLPPGYAWSTGRGMPVNGQHQMPGMANAAHPQQMLNVGKVAPGGMQGR